MTVTLRFAPSPTGNIHIGNARTALVNWLYAKKNDGQFILRFDDTDVERSKVEFAEGIERDLRWLGIEPDRIERQSTRFSSYDEAAEKLKVKGLLYACYETADELDRRRKRLLARGLPPIYDRSGLRYSLKEISAFEAEGRTAHWRFLLPNYADDPFTTQRTEVHWDDVVRGRQTVDLSSMSDPVLIRGDGTYLYTLPSVVDDIEFGITHIIRGDDHVTNTGAQIAVFEALDAKAPAFGHHNLLTAADGSGLSKRLGSLSIANLAEDGFEPMAVVSLAVLIGTSQAVEPVKDMAAMAERFDPQTITKSAAKFDMAELTGLNKRIVHDYSYDDVSDRLSSLNIGGGEEFWNAVRPNIEKVSDASDWWAIVNDATAIVDDEDREFINDAKALLPDGPWDGDTWKNWTAAVKEKTGRKGKGLFMPLRKALTGQEHGPELATILQLIGPEKTLARLS